MGKMSTKNFMIGAFIGGIVGAGTALLLAPKPGKSLRTSMNEQALVLTKQGAEIINKVKGSKALNEPQTSLEEEKKTQYISLSVPNDDIQKRLKETKQAFDKMEGLQWKE